MFRLGSLYRSERKLGSTSQAWHQGVAPSLPVPASPNIARSTESFGGAHIGSRPEGCSHQISISHPIQSVKVSLLASIFEKRLENGMYGQEGCLYDVLHIRFSNTHISYIYIYTYKHISYIPACQHFLWCCHLHYFHIPFSILLILRFLTAERPKEPGSQRLVAVGYTWN